MAEPLDLNSDGGNPQNAAASPLFISIKTVPQRSYARDLRLREDDIIVAVDGDLFNSEITDFEEMLLDARDHETPLLVTIAREKMFFEIFIDNALDVTFGYTDASRASEVSSGFAGHQISPKGEYQTYEALRDVHRHVTIYPTNYSSLATICPPLWLLQHRAIEPLAAVLAAYGAAAAVHWAAFVITVLLIGIYFHRTQFRIIRNYNIFTEHFYWFVFAARSIQEAQGICRETDPRCRFSFSYVGPPQDLEAEKKNSRRRTSS